MKKIEKIGVQLFTVRDFMHTEEAVRETFKKLKDLGYDQAQTAGCEISYEAFGAAAKDAGIEIVGTHDNFELMCNDFDTAYKNHQCLGTSIMGVGGFFSKDPKDFEELIQKANEVGVKLAPKGGRFTYHNHSSEFCKLSNGKTGMDMLYEGLDPKVTSFVLDTYWVQNGGGDVRHWIEKLAGRIDILHLKDMKMIDNNTREITEIGNGNLYWEGIIETAQKTGVKYYVVEQDNCPGDPFESLKISSEYLHKNFM